MVVVFRCSLVVVGLFVGPRFLIFQKEKYGGRTHLSEDSELVVVTESIKKNFDAVLAAIAGLEVRILVCLAVRKEFICSNGCCFSCNQASINAFSAFLGTIVNIKDCFFFYPFFHSPLKMKTKIKKWQKDPFFFPSSWTRI